MPLENGLRNIVIELENTPRAFCLGAYNPYMISILFLPTERVIVAQKNHWSFYTEFVLNAGEKNKQSCPSLRDFQRCFLKKKFPFWPYNKFLFDQTFSVKVAGFWPRYFWRFKIHVSLRVSMSSASHMIAHSILVGNRKIRSYVTCKLM